MSDPTFSAGIGRATITPPMNAVQAGWDKVKVKV